MVSEVTKDYTKIASWADFTGHKYVLLIHFQFAVTAVLTALTRLKYRFATL
jgi:hypothetical protein